MLKIFKSFKIIVKSKFKNKEKLYQYGNKFRYFAVKIWPYVTNMTQFFAFHIKRTVGGIITIGKDQIGKG